MKNTALLLIFTCFSLCNYNDQTGHDKLLNPNLLPSEPLSDKKALFLTRQVSVELDPSCDGTIVHRIMSDPCEAFRSKDECDSLHLAAVTSFLDTSLQDGSSIYLSQQQLNTLPLNKDAGGKICRTAMSTFPVSFKTSDYTGLDSTTFTVDSISKNYTVYGKLDGTPISLQSGITLTSIDTMSLGTTCTRHCILTQKITNNGCINPTKELLWDFF